MNVVHAGVTRLVVLTQDLAIKMPRINAGWYWFMRGCMANLSERDWSNWTESSELPPNPVIWAAPGGILNVYRRAEPYKGKVTKKMFGMFGDAKIDNIGIVDGRPVLLDYDCSTSHPTALTLPGGRRLRR